MNVFVSVLPILINYIYFITLLIRNNNSITNINNNIRGENSVEFNLM